MLSLVDISCWNFENPYIRSQVIRKKTGFRWSFWIFPSKQEVDFYNQNVLKVNSIFSEHIPLEFWKSVHQISSFSRKPGFWRPFWFFPSKPEVDSENRNFIHVHATDSDHMPLEFRKSVHYISSYLRKCCLRQPFWIFLTKPEVD